LAETFQASRHACRTAKGIPMERRHSNINPGFTYLLILPVSADHDIDQQKHRESSISSSVANAIIYSSGAMIIIDLPSGAPIGTSTSVSTSNLIITNEVRDILDGITTM
jgi:hypothetical protein